MRIIVMLARIIGHHFLDLPDWRLIDWKAVQRMQEEEQ